jgi:hypothetical protein
VGAQNIANARALRLLRLFNEKAQELKSYSFIGKAFHPEAGITAHFDFEKQTAEVKRVGADNEARAAMCSVLRFFLQPRDGIELHKVAELYQNVPAKDEDKHSVSENLKELDSFLDQVTIPSMSLNNEPPLSHRRILEIFLYGNLVHANSKPHDDKRRVFESWRKNKIAYPILENYFEYIVGETIKYILWLAAVNADAIMALEQMASAP